MQKHSAIAREMYKTIEPRLIEVAREVGPTIVAAALIELGQNLVIEGQFILSALQKPDDSTVH